jgi:hypothetical protein
VKRVIAGSSSPVTLHRHASIALRRPRLRLAEPSAAGRSARSSTQQPPLLDEARPSPGRNRFSSVFLVNEILCLDGPRCPKCIGWLHQASSRGARSSRRAAPDAGRFPCGSDPSEDLHHPYRGEVPAAQVRPHRLAGHGRHSGGPAQRAADDGAAGPQAYTGASCFQISRMAPVCVSDSSRCCSSVCTAG